MKAVLRYQYGRPRVLTIMETDTPTPKPDELLIRVAATTVNRTDCANLTGKPLVMHLVVGFLKPRQPITGTDFAGTVVETGSQVKDFAVGDQVWGFQDMGLATQAEFMTISAKKAVARIPRNFSLRQAAASVEGAHYAYHFINKLNLEPGKHALVNGATGAIGSATLQFLLAEGVHVTAVCGPDGVEWVRSLGAERVIDYTQEDFTRIDEKFDFVLDAVGKNRFFKCRRILKPKGVYISSELGPGAQNIFLTLLTPLFGGRRVKFPLPIDIKASMRYVAKLAEEGKFNPLIDRYYPMDQVREAYEYVLQGKKLGNVVLEIVRAEAE